MNATVMTPCGSSQQDTRRPPDGPIDRQDVAVLFRWLESHYGNRFSYDIEKNGQVWLAALKTGRLLRGDLRTGCVMIEKDTRDFPPTLQQFVKLCQGRIWEARIRDEGKKLMLPEPAMVPGKPLETWSPVMKAAWWSRELGLPLLEGKRVDPRDLHPAYPGRQEHWRAIAEWVGSLTSEDREKIGPVWRNCETEFVRTLPSTVRPGGADE